MPFDILPSHNIRVPQVQFPNIPWAEYAKMMIEASREKYQAVLHGLDSILQAADPYNIEQRRLAIAKARTETEMLPLQKERLQFEVDYRRAHGGIGPPSTYREALDRQTFEQKERNATTYDETTHPGQQTTSKYAPGGPTPQTRAVTDWTEEQRKALEQQTEINKQRLDMPGLNVTPPTLSPESSAFDPRSYRTGQTDQTDQTQPSTDTNGNAPTAPAQPPISGQTIQAYNQPPDDYSQGAV